MGKRGALVNPGVRAGVAVAAVVVSRGGREEGETVAANPGPGPADKAGSRCATGSNPIHPPARAPG